MTLALRPLARCPPARKVPARSQGARTLGLSVFGFNTGARRLYESLCYETTSVTMAKALA